MSGFTISKQTVTETRMKHGER